MNFPRRIVLAIALSVLTGCAGGRHPMARGGPDDPAAAAAPLPEPSATLAVEGISAAPMSPAPPTQPAAGHDHAAHGETAAPKPAGGHEHAH